jgi:glutathione S-transferase
MLSTPIDTAAAAVTLVAVLFYFWTGLAVGRMRGKHKVQAPAMTGPTEFECAVRVQMNTLEWMPIFLPLLWLSVLYFSPGMSMALLSWLPIGFGALWIVGRVVYMQGYMAAPDKRSSGFLIAAIAAVGLLICAIIGVIMHASAGA